jgi:hypothetical protein
MSAETELAAKLTEQKKKRIPLLIRQWVTHPLQKEVTQHMVVFALLSLTVVCIALVVAIQFMLFSILAIDDLTPMQSVLISGYATRAIVFIIVALLVSCGLNLAYGIWLSHRIAGPLIRLQNFMDAFIPDRANERLAFRDNDLFPELVSSFNSLQQRCGSEMVASPDTPPEAPCSSPEDEPNKAES